MFPCDWHNKDFAMIFFGATIAHWKFSASGTTFLSEGTQSVATFDCFQIFGHFIIAKYVLLIYFAKQIYYKLYELK